MEASPVVAVVASTSRLPGHLRMAERDSSHDSACSIYMRGKISATDVCMGIGVYLSYLTHGSDTLTLL